MGRLTLPTPCRKTSAPGNARKIPRFRLQCAASVGCFNRRRSEAGSTCFGRIDRRELGSIDFGAVGSQARDAELERSHRVSPRIRPIRPVRNRHSGYGWTLLLRRKEFQELLAYRTASNRENPGIIRLDYCKTYRDFLECAAVGQDTWAIPDDASQGMHKLSRWTQRPGDRSWAGLRTSW
jgi:hypothetical protein